MQLETNRTAAVCPAEIPAAGKARNDAADFRASKCEARPPEWLRWLLPALFFTALWLPFLDSCFGLDHSPVPIENRIPAAFPALGGAGLEGLKGYLAGLEAYFNDHFGFRRFFIRAHGFIQRKLFHEGGSEVLIGRDSWLYFAGDRALDYHLGLQTLTPEKLRQWQQLLETRRDWLARRGIKYLFVVSPNKESIYPEHLPDWANKTDATTELDQFLGYMKAHSTVEILDLRPPLLEAKKTGRTYLFTDTHWNYYGAFFAYRAIIEALGRQLPGMAPLPREAFDLSTNDSTGGDLARMLAQEQTVPEKDFISLLPRPPLKALEIKSDPAILPKTWAPDEGPVRIENPSQKYKAVMFRDSFATNLSPFLGYNFQRIVLIWQRAWDLGVIEREKPDVVIDEMLERYLDWTVPAQ